MMLPAGYDEYIHDGDWLIALPFCSRELLIAEIRRLRRELKEAEDRLAAKTDMFERELEEPGVS